MGGVGIGRGPCYRDRRLTTATGAIPRQTGPDTHQFGETKKALSMTTDEKFQALTKWLGQLESRRASGRRRFIFAAVGIICLFVALSLLVNQQNREIVGLKAEMNDLRQTHAANRANAQDVMADLERNVLAKSQYASQGLNSYFNARLDQLESEIRVDRAHLLNVIDAKEQKRIRQNDARPYISNYDALRDAKAPSLLGDQGAKGLVFSPDSRFLLAFHANTVTLWDVQKRERVARWEVPAKTINAIDLAADGKTLAVACTGGKVVLYDVLTRKETRTLVQPDKVDPVQVQFNEDGTLLAIVGDRVHVWDMQANAEKPRFSLIAERAGWPPTVAFVPGQQLLLCSRGPKGLAYAVDVRNGRSKDLSNDRLGGEDDPNKGTAVSRDGKLWRMGPYYWLEGERVETGYRGQHSFYAPPFAVGVIRYYTFCPKARFLVAGCCVSYDIGKSTTHGQLFAWELSREQSKIVLKERLLIDKFPTEGSPNAAAFSPDGSLLAVATESALVLWDAKALLPVTDPVWVAEDLREEVRILREQSGALEKRLKELESRK
jgi:WD40 repeat protein